MTKLGQMLMEDGKTEGKIEGKIEGKADEIRVIRKKLKKGLRISEIADWIEVEETYISEIAAIHDQHPEESDIEIAKRYFSEN